MMNKEEILTSISIQIAVWVVFVLLYILIIAIAGKYPQCRWEIIIGAVSYMILSDIAQLKESKR